MLSKQSSWIVNKDRRYTKEDLETQIKLKDMLDLYEDTIDKARYMAKRYLPLHKKLKNVYKQKRACQVEIKKIKSS
jgi:hypothetical protein